MKKAAFLIIMAGFGLFSCTHEPFDPPPASLNPGDTTDPNPIDTTKPCDPDTVYYNRDIQPILTANCAYSGCHDANTAQNGVILDNYNNVVSTGDVRAFDLNGSDLYEVITETDPDKRMPEPPNPPLSQGDIDLIAKWINQGALNLKCDGCDTLNLTYNNNIKAIFDQNCNNCHASNNPGTSLRLTDYQEVKDALLNTNLLPRINAEPGFPVMPQGGKMPECNIDKIEAWYRAGMPQ